jgi:hypothetical protein
MSHKSVYILTLADNAGDAKSEVRCWLDDYANREFFDYGGIIEPEQVWRVKDIAIDLEDLKAEAFKRLPDIENEIQRCKATGNRISEGYHHIRYGSILSEECCYEMPFFNITDYDWTILPTDYPKCKDGGDGRDWFAVLVDLHY